MGQRHAAEVWPPKRDNPSPRGSPLTKPMIDLDDDALVLLDELKIDLSEDAWQIEHKGCSGPKT